MVEAAGVCGEANLWVKSGRWMWEVGWLVSTSSKLSQFRAWTSPISWDYCKIACDWEGVFMGKREPETTEGPPILPTRKSRLLESVNQVSWVTSTFLTWPHWEGESASSGGERRLSGTSNLQVWRLTAWTISSCKLYHFEKWDRIDMMILSKTSPAGPTYITWVSNSPSNLLKVPFNFWWKVLMKPICLALTSSVLGMFKLLLRLLWDFCPWTVWHRFLESLGGEADRSWSFRKDRHCMKMWLFLFWGLRISSWETSLRQDLRVFLSVFEKEFDGQNSSCSSIVNIPRTLQHWENHPDRRQSDFFCPSTIPSSHSKEWHWRT